MSVARRVPMLGERKSVGTPPPAVVVPPGSRRAWCVVAGIALAVGIAPATATAQQNERGCVDLQMRWCSCLNSQGRPVPNPRGGFYRRCLRLGCGPDPFRYTTGDPRLAGSAALSGRSRDMAVRGSTTFVAAGRGVDVVDLLDPLSPEVVGTHELRAWVRGAVVQEDWAYRAKSWGVQLASVER